MPRKKKPSIHSASRRPESVFRQFLIIQLMCLCLWTSWIVYRPWDSSSPRSMIAFALMGAGLLALQIIALLWQLRRNCRSRTEEAETAARSGCRTLSIILVGALLIAGPPFTLALTVPDAGRLAWYALTHANVTSLANRRDVIILRNHTLIEGKGRIDWGMAESLERMAKDNVRTSFPKNLLLITLSSEPEEPPDDHPVRPRLAGEIAALGTVLRRNAIPALVDRECRGSCAFAFLGAPERLATADARLVLHALPEWLMSRNDQEAFLHQAGLGGLTIRRIIEATPEDPWRPDRMMLWEEQIVTAFLPDGEDLFTFFKSRYGINVFDGREGFINAQKDGYPYEEAWGQITTRLLPETIRLLPHASPDQIHGFAHLMAEQIKTFHHNNAGLCADFVPGRFPCTDFAISIDENLLRRQRDLVADILNTVHKPGVTVTSTAQTMTYLRETKAQQTLIAKGTDIIARLRTDHGLDDERAFDRSCTQTARLYEESTRLPSEETAAVILALSQAVLHQDSLLQHMNVLRAFFAPSSSSLLRTDDP